MSRVVFLGLPDDLARSLGWVLRSQAHEVRLARSLQDVACEKPEVAFVSGDTPDFHHNLASLREFAPELPLVVVTRLPENSRWLDALEAGARDYCGAPFEHVQMQWIMDTVCPPARQRAAAA
jgi:DNA-binding NtrC family response regulator